MENIQIEATEFAPSIDFNYNKCACVLEGESYLEHSIMFYKPLMEWLEEYIKDISRPLKFDFKVTYFNTLSSKRLLEMIVLLKSFEDKGGKIEINWYYEKGDIDLEEEIEDYILVTGAKINCFDTLIYT